MPQAPTRAENGNICIGLKNAATNAGYEITREMAFRENKKLGDERLALHTRTRVAEKLSTCKTPNEVSHATAMK